MTSRVRILAGLLAIVVAGVAVWIFTGGDDDTVPGAGPAASSAGPSDLAVLSVRGAPHALVAIVGARGGRDPAALVLPPGVTVVAPGQGETTTEGVAALPGPSVRIALSNAIGGWAEHYGVLDLDALAGAVDRAGGLTVSVPDVVTVDGTAIGPGESELSGTQVAAYLALEGDDAAARWASALDALLATMPLEEGDIEETDDAGAVLGLLEAAEGAAVEIAPTAPVAAQASVLDQPAADELARELFGGRDPVSVVVQNGNGEPNVGEVVAERLLPAGFRVVISQNADNFRHKRTEIAATDAEFVDDADRVRDLLSVGRVVESQVPSGLADITIVVGRDFTA